MQNFQIRFVPVGALFAFMVGVTTTGCDRGTPINIGSDPCDVSACGTPPEAKYTPCADGTQAGPTGQCLKTSSGSCAWEYSTCAATCNTGATKTADNGCNQCTCTKSGVWDCTKNTCSQTCSYQGVTYADGTTFDTTAGCCKCSAGVVTCSTADIACAASCVYDGKTYAQGASFPASDGCNNCGCSSGKVVCTTIGCANPQACTEADCGAKPHSVPTTCADGSTGGYTGQCLRDASGACSWEFRNCPTTCTYDGKSYNIGSTFPSTDGCNTCSCDGVNVVCTKNICPNPCQDADCGAKLDCGTHQCADGSVAGCTNNCVRDANGTCSREVRQCPTACQTLGEVVVLNDSCQQCTCTVDGNWTCKNADPSMCNASCSVDGVTYPNGVQFSSGGSCCTCKNGSVACVLTQEYCPGTCIYGGKTYNTGDGYPAQNGCDSCTCNNGINICLTTASCAGSDVCDIRECAGDMPTGAAYQCPDGSLGGVTGLCLRDASGVCNWEVRKCTTDCKAGDTTLTADGCGTCVCGADLNWTCTDDKCPTCPEGDPRFIEGGCPACTVGMPQTCNDDPTQNSLAGTCIRNICKCSDGFGRNPANGKCKVVNHTDKSVCTPPYDQTCNGNLEVSSYEGTCFYDGTCRCIEGNVLDPTTGLCMHPKT